MAINPYRRASPYDVETMDLYTGADLSALEYTLVELDARGDRMVKAYAGGLGYGILMNKPVAGTGPSLEAMVQTGGVVLWKTGTGGLAAGDLVKADAGGVAVTATPSDKDVVYGMCVVGAAAGLNASVKWLGPHYVHVV